MCVQADSTMGNKRPWHFADSLVFSFGALMFFHMAFLNIIYMEYNMHVQIIILGWSQGCKATFSRV